MFGMKNRVFLLACNIWVTKYTAFLCHAILKLFKYEFLHDDKRWGHVSLFLLCHNVHLGF